MNSRTGVVTPDTYSDNQKAKYSPKDPLRDRHSHCHGDLDRTSIEGCGDDRERCGAVCCHARPGANHRASLSSCHVGFIGISSLCRIIILDERPVAGHVMLKQRTVNDEKKDTDGTGEIRIGGRNIVSGLIITLALAVVLLILIRFVLL